MLKYANRWHERGLIFEQDQYLKAFKYYNYCTDVTKLRDFQYRLLLGKIVMNEDLYSWDITNENKCTFAVKQANR